MLWERSESGEASLMRFSLSRGFHAANRQGFLLGSESSKWDVRGGRELYLRDLKTSLHCFAWQALSCPGFASSRQVSADVM